MSSLVSVDVPNRLLRYATGVCDLKGLLAAEAVRWPPSLLLTFANGRKPEMLENVFRAMQVDAKEQLDEGDEDDEHEELRFLKSLKVLWEAFGQVIVLERNESSPEKTGP